MIQHWKFSTRLLVGFGVIIFLLAILGLVSYIIFDGNNSDLQNLVAHNLLTVRNATEMERFANVAVVDEKNFAIYGEDRFSDSVYSNLDSLEKAIEESDKIVAQYDDKELGIQLDIVRKNTQQFRQCYVELVKNYKTGQSLIKSMDQQGSAMNETANNYLKAKRTEYENVRKAREIILIISELVSEMRLAEQAYILHQNLKDFEIIRNNIVELQKQYQILQNLNKKIYPQNEADTDEVELIRSASTTTTEYFKYIQDWKDAHSKLLDETKNMNEKGNLVAKYMEDYLANRRTEYFQNREARLIANRIQIIFFEIRTNEKSYMLSKEQRYFNAMEAKVAELSKCYESLKNYAPETEQATIRIMQQSSEKYWQNMQNWITEQKRDDKSQTLAILAKTSDDNLDEAIRQIGEYLEAKNKNIKNIIESTFLVAQINQLILHTRISARNYMTQQKQEDWKALVQSLKELQDQHSKLSDLAISQRDRDYIAATKKLISEYEEASKSWVENSRKLADDTKESSKCYDVIHNAIQKYAESNQKILTPVTDSIFLVANVEQLLHTIRMKEKSYVISKNKEDYRQLQQDIKEVNNLYLGLNKYITTSTDATTIKNAQTAIQSYQQATQDWENVENERIKNWTETHATVISIMNATKTTDEKAWEMAHTTETDLVQNTNTGSTIILILVFIAIILGASFSWILSQSLTKPLIRVVEQLNSASEQVASAAHQMSSANQQISEGASEQASTLEEISSSMEELSSMTKQNAENASEAEKSASEAQKLAEAGNNYMKSLNEGMALISESSKEMEKIIKNIEEIAFQTNMLALNAAVEAARAGEHGRGFAVVAGEVRDLARKAGDFAKSTTALVLESSDQIKQGNEHSTQTMQIFTDILSRVTKVTELASEVSSATQEQSRGLNQIMTSVTDMNKVVQTNATNAEEGASISEEMNSQADTLDSIVQQLASTIGLQEHQQGLLDQRYTQPSIAGRIKSALTPRKRIPSSQTSNTAISNTATPKPLREKLPVKPEDVIPLKEEEFKDF